MQDQSCDRFGICIEQNLSFTRNPCAFSEFMGKRT